MASTNLSRTLSSGAATNKFTFSAWVKRSVDTAGRLLTATGSSGDTYFRFNGDATMEWSGDGSNASSAGYFITNRKFEDYLSWYHLVIRFDSTQASASNRLRFYVNGVLEESFSSYTDVNQNAVDKINLSGNTLYIGGTVSSQYFHGLMSHINYSDGYSYAPTEFGETDSTTGEWKIKTNLSISYGTNGFFILKDGNSVTDQSGNSNNFAVANGTLTNTEDCPSNVFATWNPLIGNTGATFTKGNTVVYRTTSGNYRRIGCTLGATSGKYYAEFLLGASQWAGVCLTNGGDLARTEAGNSGYMGEYSADKSVGIRNDGIVYSSGANVSSAQWNQGSMSTSDRLCLALDMDNKKLFLGKNGVWNVSSNPATNTGGITLTGDSYTFCGATSNADCMINAGNGFFGTTAISSEGTNASGNGKFEYDVPSGFTALSTKGLNL